MRNATLSLFRKMSRLDEMMIRAAMPRTSEADPDPLPAFAAPTETVAVRGGLRLVRPLTATLAEVARA